MKKHLLLLSLVYIAITTYGQNSIPNGNFETWNSSTFDNPQNYPNSSNIQNFFQYHLPFNVTQTTDAYHGAYAVQLTTNASATDTSFAYFINANPENDPSTWTGGMAFNQKPTGIRGYYKYNVATADSGTIIVAFSKAGVNLGTYIFQIGGVHNTYTLFNYIFNPALTVTPDSVIFGAISCKLVNGQPHGPAGSTMFLDSVSYTGVSSQPALMNGDFELWQSQTFNSPADWFVQGDQGTGMFRTTDKVAGSYALELITYLGQQNNHPVARSGQISTGYYPNNCNGNCNEQGGYPFSNQVDTLAFWYKYIPSGNDSASINLTFKKNGSNIGGSGMNLHAAETYQYKEIPFNIWEAPDSVIIQIQSSSWNDTLPSFVGSNLKIDELYFKSQLPNTGIFNYGNNKSISIFPNPSNGKFQIQGLGINVQRLEIYNVFAEKVYATSDFKQQSSNEIDLSKFRKGIYIAKIYNGTEIHTKTIVIQ